MKKKLSLFLVFVLSLACFSGCVLPGFESASVSESMGTSENISDSEKESASENGGAEKYQYDFTITDDDGEFKILQLSDTQIIDATSGRGPEIWQSGYPIWNPEHKQDLLYKYMDDAVEKNNPDLIVLIGDNIYSDFDPEYKHLEELIEKMDSYDTPWTFVFGNHDLNPGGNWFKDSGMTNLQYVNGVLERYENAENCLFKRTEVSESRYNEYTIGVKQNGEYVLSMYMLDTGDETRGKLGITKAQCDWVADTGLQIEKSYGQIPAHMYMHVALSTYEDALMDKYPDWWTGAILGGTLEAKDGDFGLCQSVSAADPRNLNGEMFENAKDTNVTNIYAGHAHKSSFSVLYQGIRLTMGLKTGRYDEFNKNFLGSTLTTFKDGVSVVEHKHYTEN